MQRRKEAALLGTAILAVIFALVVASLWLFSPAQIAEAPLRRFAFTLPVGFSTHGPITTLLAISPNGKHIAFVAEGAPEQLRVQDLDQQQARVIDGTDGASTSFH